MLLPNDKSEDPESSSIKPFDLLGTEGCSRGRDPIYSSRKLFLEHHICEILYHHIIEIVHGRRIFMCNMKVWLLDYIGRCVLVFCMAISVPSKIYTSLYLTGTFTFYFERLDGWSQNISRQ